MLGASAAFISPFGYQCEWLLVKCRPLVALGNLACAEHCCCTHVRAPILHAGNLMVFTAGNYKTMDFVRVGVFLQVGLCSCRPQTRCSKTPD